MYYSGEKIILNYFNFDKKRKSEPALKFFYLFLSVDDLEFIHLFISLTGIVFHIIDNTYFYFAFFKLGKFQFFNFLIILSKYLRKQFFFSQIFGFHESLNGIFLSSCQPQRKYELQQRK